VRIALQTGAALVPVLGFGENEMYTIRPPVPGSFRARSAAVFKKYLGFTLPDAVANGMFGGRESRVVVCCCLLVWLAARPPARRQAF
jgi:hypothetical protein